MLTNTLGLIFLPPEEISISLPGLPAPLGPDPHQPTLQLWEPGGCKQSPGGATCGHCPRVGRGARGCGEASPIAPAPAGSGAAAKLRQIPLKNLRLGVLLGFISLSHSSLALEFCSSPELACHVYGMWK